MRNRFMRAVVTPIFLAALFAFDPLHAASMQIGKMNDCNLVLSAGHANVYVNSQLCGSTGKPQISVTYYWLDSNASSLLVQGVLPPKLQALVGDTNPFVKNAVFHELQKLVRDYSGPAFDSALNVTLDGFDRKGQSASDEIDVGIDSASLLAQVQSHGLIPELRKKSELSLWLSGDANDASWFQPPGDDLKTILTTTNWPTGYNFVYVPSVYEMKYFQNADAIGRTVIWRYLNRADLKDYEARMDAIASKQPVDEAETAASVRGDENGAEETEDPNAFIDDHFAVASIQIARSVRYLTAKSFPNDFMLVVGRLDYKGECDAGSWGFYGIPRQLYSQIAVIENTGTAAAVIDKLEIREAINTGLRPADDPNTFTTKTIVPAPNTLTPGAKLIVPTRIELRYDFLEDVISADSLYSDRTFKRIQNYAEKTEFTLKCANGGDRCTNESLFSKTRESFGPSTVPHPRDDYAWGEEIAVDSVTIGGERYALRQYDPNNLSILAQSEMGSCPHVLTDDGNGMLVDNGEFLADHSGAEQFGVDRVVLKSFNGEVVIREYDPEVASLDRVAIEAHHQSGLIETLEPADSRLSSRDGIMVRVRMGGEIRVKFPAFKANDLDPVDRYWFRAEGFYDRYTLMSATNINHPSR